MAGSAQMPPALQPPARIGTCRASFLVADPRGPLSSPEKLLDAVRREILPALSDVLESPEWLDIDMRLPLVEIDLGDWPDEPVWSDLRYVLALRLRLALTDCLDVKTRYVSPQSATRRGSRQDAVSTAPPPPSVETESGAASDNAHLDNRKDRDAERALVRFSQCLASQPGEISQFDIRARLDAFLDERLALLQWAALETATRSKVFLPLPWHRKILSDTVQGLARENGDIVKTGPSEQKVGKESRHPSTVKRLLSATGPQSVEWREALGALKSVFAKAGLSPGRSEDLALRSIASVFDMREKMAKGHADAIQSTEKDVADAFVADPRTCFSTASAQHRKAIARLMAQSDIARAALIGPDALDPEDLRWLARQDRRSAARALLHLSLEEIERLLPRLLQPGATLLASRLLDLRKTAVSPHHALREVALALLEERAVDLEAIERSQRAAEAATEMDAEDSVAPTSAYAWHTLCVPFVDRRKGTFSPLDRLLLLAGFSPHEVSYLFQGRLGPVHVPKSNVSAASETSSLYSRHEVQTQTAAPSPLAKKRLEADLGSQFELLIGSIASGQQSASGFDEILHLVVTLWPGGVPASSTLVRKDFAQSVAHVISALTARLAKMPEARFSAAVHLLEPDGERQKIALRSMSARLSQDAGMNLTGVHARARRLIETMIGNHDARQAPRSERSTKSDLSRLQAYSADDSTGDETIWLSETAGLVLLHPFFALLFDRLDVSREGKSLSSDDVPRALAALQFLAGGPSRDDPLQKILLGLELRGQLPDPAGLSPDHCVLMDGLLRSVIDRWGRLGATSPDGLRETFIRRTCTLRVEPNGFRLKVMRGPFDMLLDSLPWDIDRVALPWMCMPCFVTWQEANDA